MEKEAPVYSDKTQIGAMAHYVSRGGVADFQPMNANFGIIAPPEERMKGGKKVRYAYYASRALAEIDKLTGR